MLHFVFLIHCGKPQCHMANSDKIWKDNVPSLIGPRIPELFIWGREVWGNIFLCVVRSLQVYLQSGHIELLKLTHYLWDCTKWKDDDSLFMCICSATDFTLKPSDCPDTEFPVRIADSDSGCLWYRKDNKFKIPKGDVWVLVSVLCASFSMRDVPITEAFNVIKEVLTPICPFACCSLHQIPLNLLYNPAVC